VDYYTTYIKSTHINDDHLDLADDEHAVSQRLRHENVPVVHVDRVPPAAVDALVAAHVLLQISLAIAITNSSSSGTSISVEALLQKCDR
jgi:hypothetical protein